jgi:hypothetical protein
MIEKGRSKAEEAGLFEAGLFMDTSAPEAGARIQAGLLD